MEPHARLYLYTDDAEGLFGDGRYRLLTAIREHGSIQQAARILGRGYRKAWGDIKRAEEGFGRKIVRKRRGGPAGGSTELTEFGCRLLEGWERYRAEVQSCMERSFDECLKDVLEGTGDER
jgi:molybdate transport system regulatory protein